MNQEDEQRIRRTIVRTLENYPGISASMLGLHIRPYNRNWHLILNMMVSEGIVKKEPVTLSYHGAMRYTLNQGNGDGATS